MSDLRSAVLRGGAAMAMRELAGLVIRLGGIVVITRLLGPTNFGLYAGSLVIVVVLSVIAGLGAEVYLPRSEEEPTRQAYDETLGSLLVSGAAVAALTIAVVLAFPGLLPDLRFRPPLIVMALMLPITAMRIPPRIMLERRFDWGRVALVDVGGDIALYATGVALAIAGAGVWAPVAGYCAWQLWSLVGACVLAGYRPRPRFAWSRLRILARYGLTLSTATLLNRAEDLVNPFVVGGFLGPGSVGFASFATRLGDTVAFPARASWRLALVAFGQVQSDLARLRRGIEESMGLQVLTLGAAFWGFSLVAPFVVPAIFGDRWKPALDLLPFVSIRYIVIAINGPQASALYVLGMHKTVVRLALGRAVAAAVTAVILVPTIGLIGFGFAMLAPTVSLVGFALATRANVAPSYREVAVWAAAFVPGCFAPLVGAPWGLLLCLTVIPAALSPLGRHRLGDYRRHLFAALFPRRAAVT